MGFKLHISTGRVKVKDCEGIEILNVSIFLPSVEENRSFEFHHSTCNVTRIRREMNDEVYL